MDMEDQDLAQPALLGLDLGTSGAKAVLLGVDGRPLAEAGVGYPVDSPRPGWAETDPAAWWRAVSTAVRAACDQAAGVQVAAVGLDGQMHGLVLTDAAGQPLRPALLWADARAGEETAAWRRLPAPRRAALANPIVPGMTGPLLRWVARHEPQAYRRAGWALLAKDWVRHRLTGEVATDPSDASATLLWDLPADRWADDVAAAVGLEPELLPPVAASGDQAGSLRADAAEALGLREGIPVAVGAADTAATLLATGLTDPAQVQLTVGTGGQIVRPVVPRPSPASAPRTHLYRAAAPDRWYAMAAVQNAGLALDWVRRTLRASWSELYGAARAGPPGALGVTFVPYLSGERTPVLRSEARGAWTGLGMAADRTALLQAAVEGVAFSLRHALEALPGPRPDHLRLAGGGTLDPRFRALLADVLQVELRPTDVRSASAVGAALLAAEAARLPRPAIPLSTSIPITPSGRSAAYNEPFDRYVQLAQQFSTVATPPRSGRPVKPDPSASQPTDRRRRQLKAALGRRVKASQPTTPGSPEAAEHRRGTVISTMAASVLWDGVGGTPPGRAGSSGADPTGRRGKGRR